MISVRDPHKRRERIWQLVAVLIFCAFIAILLIPALASAGADAVTEAFGTTELTSQRVGNYQASVLRAADANALSAWLEAKSLKALNGEAKAIVDDYISRKWCFVVARLVQDGNAVATPHPISVTFPSDSIVYPMKLTAMAASTTRVELFVAADKQAFAPGFDCVVADRFEKDKSFMTSSPCYRSRTTDVIIGNPDVMEHLWPGCIVTRLTADLKPSQMGKDITVGQQELSPYRQIAFSPKGRAYVMGMTLLAGTCVALVVAAVVFKGMRRPTKAQLRFFWITVCLAPLTCASLWVFLPVVPVQSGRQQHPMRERVRLMNLDQMAQMAAMDGAISNQMTRDQLANLPTILRQWAKSDNRTADFMETLLQNPFTGREMTCERSPGNFFIPFPGRICFYDADCCELRIDLPDKKSD